MRALPDLVAFGSSSSTELGEVKTCLNPCIDFQGRNIILLKSAYCDKELTPKESIPGVLSIICEICIKEEGPLITSHEHLTTLKLFPDSANKFRAHVVVLMGRLTEVRSNQAQQDTEVLQSSRDGNREWTSLCD